jgi:hypothetical protein
MRFEDFSFGSIRIDGITYNYDVVIDRGEISKRKKKASNNFAMRPDTRLSQWERKYRGTAGDW